MGTNKALVTVDGSTLLDRVIDVVAPVVGQLFIVGGDVTHRSAELVADQYPGEGPVGGLVTALEAASSDSIVLVGCDLPQLNPNVLRTMLETLDQTGAHFVVPLVRGRRQWHCSVWRRDVRSILAPRFAAGARSFRAAVAGLDECAIVFSDIACFADIDTPNDLERHAGRTCS